MFLFIGSNNIDLMYFKLLPSKINNLLSQSDASLLNPFIVKLRKERDGLTISQSPHGNRFRFLVLLFLVLFS